MERAERMKVFRQRLARLDKAVKNDWPAPVVCGNLKLCLVSAMLLYGDYGSGIVSELLLTQTREIYHLCPFDGRPATEEHAGMCVECWQSAADDDALADEAEPPAPTETPGGKA